MVMVEVPFYQVDIEYIAPLVEKTFFSIEYVGITIKNEYIYRSISGLSIVFIDIDVCPYTNTTCH